jgi:hypothetical protein
MALLQADDIIKRFDSLASLRGEWEHVWQLCSEYVLPRSGEFRRQAHRLFDDTAPLALGRFAAALEAVLTPRTRKWHVLVTGDPALDQDPEISRWLEWVRDAMFRARYAPEANFANQMTEAYLSLGVHGTACVFVDDELGQGLRYRNIPVHQLYLAEDGAGRVDTVFRCYKLTARQALAEFGEELPDSIITDAKDAGRQENEHEFIHGVFPRRELDPRRRDSRNMPFASVHLARSARKILRESGYRSMPYVVSRFVLAPGEVYGRSPAMSVLGSIIQINAIQKTIIRAAEKMVDPPVLTADDDVLSGFSLKPAAIIPGGISATGEQLIRPLLIEGKLPVGLEMIDDRRRVINEAYYLNLFQILVERPGEQTATEVVQRAQEKAQLLAPAMGRQQSELLRGIIVRELDIMIQGGVLVARPMPEALEAAGAGVTPKYETEMTQALDSADGVAVMRFVQSLGTIAQMGPDAAGVLDLVDYDQAAQVLRRSFGAPAETMLPPQAVAALRKQKEEAQQVAAAMQQAQMAAGAGADFAGALGGLAQVGQSLQGVQGV